MIVVTGAAGFIGSRVISHLNQMGRTDIIAVDDLSNGMKFKNLKDLDFAHYIDKDEFLAWLSRNSYYVDLEGEESLFADVLVSDIEAIIHLGANSSTTCFDKSLMKDNYDFSVKILDHLCTLDIPTKFIYASSASVYGNSKDGSPDPLNLYAFSKYLFDKYVMRKFDDFMKLPADVRENHPFPQIVGLRFFNVYGGNEWHKGAQASVIHKWVGQFLEEENPKINVFLQDEVRRDFVHVDDVCEVIKFFLENAASGIFDVGTGEARSFGDVVCACGVLKYMNVVPFPEKLKGHYQYFTQANLASLRAAGYDKPFMSVEGGVSKYYDELRDMEHSF